MFTLRGVLGILLLGLIITTGCRRKTLIDEYEAWVENSETFDPFSISCNNEEYDFDLGEQDIDCGDNCEPCTFSTPCLNILRNELVIDSGASVKMFGAPRVYHDEYEIQFKFDVIDDVQTFVVEMDSAVLKTSQRKLETTSQYNSVGFHRIHLSYESYNYGTYKAYEDYLVYIVEQNGEQYITFCNVDASNSNQTPMTFSGSFKISE